MGVVEKVEILKAYFASVFSVKALLQESQTLELSERVWGMEDLPLVKVELAHERLGHNNIQKSMCAEGAGRDDCRTTLYHL